MEIQTVLIKCLSILDQKDVKEVEGFVTQVFKDTKKAPHFAYGEQSEALAIATSKMKKHDVDMFTRIFEILEDDDVSEFIFDLDDGYDWLTQDNIKQVVPYSMRSDARMYIHEATWSIKKKCWYVVLNESIHSYDKWYIL